MMDYEKTGKLIQELRKEKKLTQLALSKKLGVTDRAVSKWERGRGFPDVSILQPLSEILGVSVAELLSGERRNTDEFEGPEGIRRQQIQAEQDERETLEALEALAEENAIRNRREKRDSIFIFAFVILMILLIISASAMLQRRHAPLNFQEDILSFDQIRITLEDGRIETIVLEDDEDGEMLRSQIQIILRENMPSPEILGKMEPLPDNVKKDMPVELVGLITLYRQGYYDVWGWGYYTFPGMEAVYQQVYDLCLEKVTV